MKLFIVPLAAAAIALTAAPALAKSKKHRMHGHHHHSQSYYGGGQGYGGAGYGVGWNTRNVSDPSFVSRGYRRAQASGRCVVDLGYGRYEYCGW